MKKKLNIAKAASNIKERMAQVFNTKVVDEWVVKSGAILTLAFPQFTNSMDVCSEAGLCIAIAKNRGIITDGTVNVENNELVVKIF